jgi:sulfite reductase (NADPH) hemoprotein beta-component
VIGPSFAAEQVPDVIATVLNVFTQQRHEDELFIDVVDRLGIAPFKAAVYDKPTLETNNASTTNTDFEELGCYA